MSSSFTSPPTDVSASEIAMLTSLAVAAIFFTFLAQQRIDPQIARRLFMMVNIFTSMILAFQVSWMRTVRYLGAIVGTTILHSFMVTFFDQPIMVKKTL